MSSHGWAVAEEAPTGRRLAGVEGQVYREHVAEH